MKAYVFHDYLTGEFIGSTDIRKVYRTAQGHIKESLECGKIPHGKLYVADWDDMLRVDRVICFWKGSELGRPIDHIGLLSVRAYNVARRKKLVSGWDLWDYLKANENAPAKCGRKTVAEWKQYIAECVSTPERV